MEMGVTERDEERLRVSKTTFGLLLSVVTVCTTHRSALVHLPALPPLRSGCLARLALCRPWTRESVRSVAIVGPMSSMRHHLRAVAT